MSKAIKKVASVALPIAGALTGNPLLAAAGGAAGGLAGGGGLKGALMGAAGGYLGGGGLGTPGTSINWTSAAPGYSTGLQTVGGSGLLGAISRGIGGTGLGQSVNSGIGAVSNMFGGSSGGAAAGGNALGNVVSNVFSGIQGTQAYKDMEKAQLASSKQGLAAISPFAATGTAANNRLAALMGLDPNADQDAILAQLRNTPGYDFRMQQGQQAIDRSLGARGKIFSGEALKASQEYGQGLADQTYNDYLQSLAQQSGQGLGAAGSMANIYGQQGQIRAGGIENRNNLLSDVFGNILNPMQYARA